MMVASYPAQLTAPQEKNHPLLNKNPPNFLSPDNISVCIGYQFSTRVPDDNYPSDPRRVPGYRIKFKKLSV